MSKKHYVAIAEIIRQERETVESDDKILCGMENTSRALAWNLANYFASENPRFDTVRFLKACGIEE